MYKWFDLPAQQRQWLQYGLAVLLLLGLVFALLPSEYIETGWETNDKLMHATAFFGFAILLDMASSRDFWRFQFPLLLAYGALIEVLQSFFPWRTFSLLDLLADAAGLLLYWLMFRLWLKVKA